MILLTTSSSPSLLGEGDRTQCGGGAAAQTAVYARRPSTMLRMVPLPIFDGEDL